MLNSAQVLRRTILPVLRRFNPGDVSIRHHWTGDPFRLHSFRHKGYWWHGRKREALTMALFAKLVRPNDIVFDIGAHIGYVGLYLSWLTGDSGSVYCFEPSPSNLPYLDRNVASCPRKNIRIVRAAAGDRAGEVPFFVERLTGQNCTTIEGLPLLGNNSRFSGMNFQYEKCVVPMIAADSLGIEPDFVKIDVESGELSVLRGMEHIIGAARPRIMVETAAGSDALRLLAGAGYIVFPHRECNVFAIHRDDEQGLSACRA